MICCIVCCGGRLTSGTAAAAAAADVLFIRLKVKLTNPALLPLHR
jgi:hypothetical protein